MMVGSFRLRVVIVGMIEESITATPLPRLRDTLDRPPTADRAFFLALPVCRPPLRRPPLVALFCSVSVKTVGNAVCVNHEKVWVAVIKARLSRAAVLFGSLRAGR